MNPIQFQQSPYDCVKFTPNEVDWYSLLAFGLGRVPFAKLPLSLTLIGDQISLDFSPRGTLFLLPTVKRSVIKQLFD
ncbi:hypothetical protein F2Q70_00033734 [Brassica cretica]|uniref:Uncharacterized protein n=1 Tax=Brassica cretica TaxID=69181 RepID=A0A8S9JWN8_BRACR|nr:hypothetical protein F2Q68_00028606 [Brassica cretica]KAF2586229.1 hypothetical protein F2Q70_00033734 [Brassica cretica]